MKRRLLSLAALSAAIAVAAGAFGAHAATGKPAEWLRTGGEYQLVHAVATMVAAQLGSKVAAALLLGGSCLFATTLYAMALGAPRWFGAITPIGGMAMIGGWVVLAFGAAKSARR